MQKTENKRNASMEALRILSMGMVLMLHYLSGTGSISTGQLPLEGVRALGGLLEILCIPAVDVYVLLSGYYLSRSRFKAGRLLRLYGRVWFYSVFLALAGRLFWHFTPTDGIYGLLSVVLPVTMKHYWFVTAYFGMAVLAPILGAGVWKLGQRELAGILAILFAALCVLKSIVPFQLTIDQAGYDTVWFLALFLLGAYFARFGIPFPGGRRGALAGYFLCSGAGFAAYLLLRFLYTRTGKLLWYSGVMFHYNSLTCLGAAVCLFAFFALLPEPQGRAGQAIRKISPLTFCVYLIHQHMALRDLWYLSGERAFAGLPFILRALLTVLASYAVCLFIEWARTVLAALILRPLLGRLGVTERVHRLEQMMTEEEEKQGIFSVFRKGK